MKKSILFLIIGLFPYFLAAQQSHIKGKIVNENNIGVEFANITLLTRDSIPVKREVSSRQGLFAIAAFKGKYILQVKLLKAIVFSKFIDVEGDLDLGNIPIENIKNIEEVGIEGKKKLIERKVDRWVFNVQNSIAATGGDALDVLRIAPSIRVQNDQISMMGKSSISVMVDDRQILLSGEEMINFLKTIKSDNIKSIEVITNPPAKYEAEGNSGIVDIKLKKARANSWSNTTRTSYIQATYPSFSIGNSFSYQKNKLSLLFDISVSPYTRIYTIESKYDYPKEYWKNNIYNKARIHPISGLLNLGYDVSKNLRIGFQYLGNMSHLKKDEIGTANAYNRGVGDLKKLISSLGQTTADYYNHSFNGNLLKKLDTLGKQLSLDVDYFAYKADRNNLLNAEYKSYLSAVSKKEYIENLNLQKINNFSTKIDFDMPYEWARLSFGGKLSFTKSNSNIDISRYNATPAKPVLESYEFDDFTYDENIQSAYFSVDRKWNTRWETKVGLRIEATQNKGYSPSSNQVHQNNYIKLFPTLYLSYKLNSENTFAISYGRRVNRPSYSNLNPARWYLTANSYEEGNPFLQPSFTSDVEVSHTYKDLLTTKLSFSKTRDGFGQLILHDLQNDIQSFIRKNYYDYDSFVCSEYIQHAVFAWWRASAEVSIYYSETKAYSDYLNPQYSGWGGSFSSTNDFVLNKRKSFMAQLLYEYNYPSIVGENKTQDYSSLGIGIKLLCMEKQLQIALNANNILGSDRVNTSNITQDIRQSFRQYYDTQYIRLSVSYQWGNKKLNTPQKTTGNEEEKRRVN